MKTLTILLALATLPVSWLAAQDSSVAGSRSGVTIMPSLGVAYGAENQFIDFGIAAGLFVGHLELRGHFGGLAFPGACAAIFPNKCGDGDGGYYDVSAGFRLPDRVRPAGGWILSLAAGKANDRQMKTLGVTIGRDHPISGRWLIRLEVFGRHLYDDVYEETWGSSHRQFGVRLGLGGWTALD